MQTSIPAPKRAAFYRCDRASYHVTRAVFHRDLSRDQFGHARRLLRDEMRQSARNAVREARRFSEGRV